MTRPQRTDDEQSADRREEGLSRAEFVLGRPVERSEAEIIAARTPDDVPADGMFRHTYTVTAPTADELTGDELDGKRRLDMLQQALNAGLRPIGEATRESVEEHSRTYRNVTLNLTYAVPVRLASEVHPRDVLTPSKALRDGDELPPRGQRRGGESNDALAAESPSKIGTKVERAGTKRGDEATSTEGDGEPVATGGRNKPSGK